MDELREKILKHLHRYYNRKEDFYIGAKDSAMAYAAGLMNDSKEPFRKVYDVVTEAVQDFWFGEGK